MGARIVVIGRSGQLATELARLAPPAGVTLEAFGRDRFDLADVLGIEGNLRALRPDAVINATGFTAVDAAETQADAAFTLNRDGPAALARGCAELGVPLVHLSTDYVFDGAKAAPYVEADARAPLNIYGRSKAEGEDAVLASGATAAVVRTSWVFASHGANFVRTMLRLSETEDEVSVVADQVGRPTWARDLAQCCLDLALNARDGDAAAEGVLHFCGADDATWADFAEAIFAETGKATRVKRVSTAEYPTPARRPLNSRLDTTRITSTLGIQPRPLREVLRLCLHEL
jgi:dTDP-4-dehydrorhamnose reductase